MILTRDRLCELIVYDPVSGILRWKKSRANLKAGSVAKSRLDGYLRIRVDGKSYMAHRLAWLYMTGEWPSGQIDHINGVRDDNRFVNLRDVETNENRRNRKKNLNSTSGFKGVSFKRWQHQWVARIQTDGRRLHLGYFDTAEEAHVAYCTAAKKYHGQFARTA